MPKRKELLSKIWTEENDHVSRQIFHELDLYAKDKGFYPVQNALFGYMTKPQFNEKTHKQDPPRYPDLGQWTYDYWFDRLVDEGYIEIDSATRSIRCVHLQIVEKDSFS